MSETETGQDAPVVDNTATQPESAQVNAENEAVTETVEQEAPVEKTFTQKELDEIIQKRLAKAEAKAERRAAQAYREALEAVTRTQQPAQQKSTEPTRDQFASDAEWIDAKVEHKLQQREAEAKAKESQASQQSLAKKTESIYAEAEKLDGFDRDTFEDLPLTRQIAEALIDSDVAPKLMQYMVTNPDEVERIAKLSPARQAAELGKLEVKLQQAPKTSKAPPPISPVGSKGSTSMSLESADLKTYKELRAKQGARWAR